MAHLSYLVKDIVPAPRWARTGCVHQTLMGTIGAENSSGQCNRSSLQGVSHGFLCEEHYPIARRRPVLMDPDTQQVVTIIVLDARAISRGKVTNHSGVRTLEAGEPCNHVPISSRVCERGTICCTVKH